MDATPALDDATSERLRHALTIVLAVALVAAVAGVGYVAMTSGGQEDPFTEFYILGPGGEAADYPTNLSTGETGEFIVGVTNNEHREMTYTVVVARDGTVLDERTVDVGAGETWEDEVAFAIDEPGNHRLDILLYTGFEPDLDGEPYQDLRLMVDIRE